MVVFAAPTLLVLVTLSLLSAEETDYVVVRYPQRTINPPKGSSAKLSCEANYDFDKCGVVHVVWHRIPDDTKTPSSEMIDSNRYLTTVSESICENNWRCRQVVTEIMSVSTGDSGLYQCKASCGSGEQAMGHFITIQVKSPPYP